MNTSIHLLPYPAEQACGFPSREVDTFHAMLHHKALQEPWISHAENSNHRKELDSGLVKQGEKQANRKSTLPASAWEKHSEPQRTAMNQLIIWSLIFFPKVTSPTCPEYFIEQAEQPRVISKKETGIHDGGTLMLRLGLLGLCKRAHITDSVLQYQALSSSGAGAELQLERILCCAN